jgi:hypothetical protein
VENRFYEVCEILTVILGELDGHTCINEGYLDFVFAVFYDLMDFFLLVFALCK